MAGISLLEGTQFLGRSQLLSWLNNLTGLGYSKIEQCASGAAICQVFHSLYPNDINIRRVNFKARLEYEFVQNFKVLQACFKKLHIEKKIDIERLIRAKYQDNLEFLQWVKAFYDKHCTEESEAYDGAAVRQELQKPVQGRGRAAQGLSAVSSRANYSASNGIVTGPRGKGYTPRSTRGPEKKVGAVGKGLTRSKENVNRARMGAAEKKELAELRARVQDMDITIEDLEKERDFYFNKLRDVEILIQTHETENPGKPLEGILATIQSVLYATEEDAEEVAEEEIPQEEIQDLEQNSEVITEEEEVVQYEVGDEYIDEGQQVAYEQKAY